MMDLKDRQSVADYTSFVLPLLLNSSTWIFRRVETFQISDDATIRSTVSLDFDLAATGTGKFYLEALKDEALDWLIIPVGLLTKSPLDLFDLRDDSGHAIPLATSAQATAVAEAALAQRARHLLGPADSDSLRVYWRPIVNLSSALAGQYITALSGPRESQQAEIRRLSKTESLVQLTEKQQADFDGLMEDGTFAYLARSFSTRHLALAILPGDWSGRRMIKMTYSAPLAWDQPWRPRTIAGRFALRAMHSTVELPLVRLSGTYHAQVLAPDATEIRRLRIDATDGDGRRELLHEQLGPRAVGHLYVADPVFHDNRLHELIVDIRAQRRGLLRSALAAGFLACFALLLVALLHKRLAALEGTSAATLLLIIPGIVASYISRPGEHPVASRLFLGVRLCMGVVAFASYAAGAALATDVSEVALNRLAYGLFSTAAAATVLVLVANVVASTRPRSSKKSQ